jgi:hypothetical protein
MVIFLQMGQRCSHALSFRRIAAKVLPKTEIITAKSQNSDHTQPQTGSRVNASNSRYGSAEFEPLNALIEFFVSISVLQGK